jgi:hypothetical protein
MTLRVRPGGGLFDDGAGPDGQQPPKRSLAHPGDRAQLLLTAGGSLPRRQSQPGGEVTTALEGFMGRCERDQSRRRDRSYARDGHQSACDRVVSCT